MENQTQSGGSSSKIIGVGVILLGLGAAAYFYMKNKAKQAMGAPAGQADQSAESDKKQNRKGSPSSGGKPVLDSVGNIVSGGGTGGEFGSLTVNDLPIHKNFRSNVTSPEAKTKITNDDIYKDFVRSVVDEYNVGRSKKDQMNKKREASPHRGNKPFDMFSAYMLGKTTNPSDSDRQAFESFMNDVSSKSSTGTAWLYKVAMSKLPAMKNYVPYI